MKPQTLFLACLTTALITCTTSATAQFNRYGGGLCFSTGIDEPGVETGNPGFNLRGVYEFNKRLYLIPSLSFYVPKQISGLEGTLTTFYGHIDAHLAYKLAYEQQIMFYAIAGPDLTNLYKKYDTDDPRLESGYTPYPGLSIGTGIEMIVNDQFNALVQARYIISGQQQLVITIGAHYYFEGRRFKHWR